MTSAAIHGGVVPGIVALVVTTVLLTACTSVHPSASGAPSLVPTMPPPAVTSSPAGPPRTPAPIPAAGRPYDAAAILEAMRRSVRPGGVPEELQTKKIAADVAAAIWTWTGRPHPQLQVAGACGPTACSLEVAGTPHDAAGTDLYVFAVAPSSGGVRLEAADLHGYPADLDAQLDALVRDQVPADRLAGLAFAAAAWQAPPQLGRFVAAYRSGGEEGSPAVDVVMDLFRGTVLEVREL